MSAFMKSLTSTLLLAIVLLLASGNAHALLPTHECGYCHSLHGSDTGFVPRSDPVNIEVLCMGCHLTANGTTAAVPSAMSSHCTTSVSVTLHKPPRIEYSVTSTVTIMALRE